MVSFLFKLGEASQWPSRWARLSVDCVRLSACCHMQRREGGELLAWPRMLAWRDREQVQHRKVEGMSLAPGFLVCSE